MKVTYTRLRDGGWGVRAEGGEPAPGQKVQVTNKDGTAKDETVGRVLWRGDGVCLCTVVSDSDSGKKGFKDAAGNTFTGCKCVTCGHEERINRRGYPDVKIYRSGECADCYEERKMGY